MTSPISNLLLQSLTAADQSALRGELEAVGMPVNTVLFEPRQVPRYLYFMTSGLASIVAPMASGETVEVGLLGREAMAGGIHLLGSQLSPSRCFMQVGGTALRIEYRKLEQAFDQHRGLRRRVLECVQYEALTLGQLSACNRVHEVEERLARWLLMVQDRLGVPDLPLTQEFLADMLGARRSTVTVAAGTLQRAGLITYRRGNVNILDRPSLEDVACECYPITRRLFQNLYTDGHQTA